MNSKGNIGKRILNWSAFPALVLLALVLLVNSFVTSNAWKPSIIVSFLNTNAMTVCVSLGVTIVILTGGIDISLGALVSMCNVMAVQLMVAGVPFYWALLITMAAAVAGGLLNGFIVAYLGVTPLLTTYATSTIFAGLALLISPTPGGFIDTQLMLAFYKKFLGIPMVVFWIAAAVVLWKIYRRTPNGMKIYATGCNEGKAFLSGINVKRVKLFAYGFAGFAAGVGAICMTCMIGAGDPLVGSSVGMTAISGAVIGGVSLSGGKGDVAGPIFGCLFLGYLTNLIVALKFDAYSQTLLKALILLFCVIISVFVSMRKGKKGGISRA